jgi:tetratricopeptide (TPR) repeat protein
MKVPDARADTGEPPAVPSLIITDQKRANDLYLLGHAYLKLEKDPEAIKAFQECVKLNPEDAEAHYGLGLGNFRMRRFKAAADAFKKATTLRPQMAKAHYGLTLTYQELGNQHGLMEELRILEKLDPSLARKVTLTFPDYKLPCRRGIGCP